jgi:hypothetical protein
MITIRKGSMASLASKENEEKKFGKSSSLYSPHEDLKVHG